MYCLDHKDKIRHSLQTFLSQPTFMNDYNGLSSFHNTATCTTNISFNDSKEFHIFEKNTLFITLCIYIY